MKGYVGEKGMHSVFQCVEVEHMDVNEVRMNGGSRTVCLEQVVRRE